MKKECATPTCYLIGRQVETDETVCLACGNQLKSADEWLTDLFKDLFPKSK